MQLIRIGDTGGFNLDMLLAWEVTTPSPPAAPEPEPTPESAPESAPAPAPAPGPAPAPETGEVTTPPAEVYPHPPEPLPADVAPAPLEEPPPLQVVLHLAAGAGVHDLTLEGSEAEAMVAYLNSKSGALVR